MSFVGALSVLFLFVIVLLECDVPVPHAGGSDDRKSVMHVTCLRRTGDKLPAADASEIRRHKRDLCGGHSPNGRATVGETWRKGSGSSGNE
eukprot:366427-Chlamydomonas_euryale.AAC.1